MASIRAPHATQRPLASGVEFLCAHDGHTIVWVGILPREVGAWSFPMFPASWQTAPPRANGPSGTKAARPTGPMRFAVEATVRAAETFARSGSQSQPWPEA